MRAAQLFSSTETTAEEIAAQAAVDYLCAEFLSTPSASSGVPLGALVEQFSSSEVVEHPVSFAEYLDRLDRDVVRHSTRTCSPTYVGHMTSALPYFVRPLAKLVTVLNQNPVKVETAKSLSPCERQTLSMLHRLVYDLPPAFYERHGQDPASTLGIIGSGGTLANVTALWCARNASLGPSGGFAGVEVEGMAAALRFYGYRDAVVIGSTLMHYSFDKAAGLLGIGTRNLVRVPVDARGSIRVDELRRVVEECIRERRHVIAIVGVAGTTDAGSIDPLREVARVARDAGVHFHVDAAWGGVLAFSRRHRHLLDGIEDADSVTIDGHKQMYTPMGTGVLLCRDPYLARSVEKHARYILRKGSVDLGRRALEGSRPGSVLHLHAALHLIGRHGFEQLIEDGMRKARYMADQVRARPGLDLLMEPQTNILLYRHLPSGREAQPGESAEARHDHEETSQLNTWIQKIQRQEGRSFVSRTMLDLDGNGTMPTVALRAVLANPLTREPHIDAVLDEQEAIAARLHARAAPVP